MRIFMFLAALVGGVYYFSDEGISKAARMSQGNMDYAQTINQASQ